MNAAAYTGSRPRSIAGTPGCWGMTTIVTPQPRRAWRTAANWAGVPDGGVVRPKPSDVSTSKPAFSGPARLATPCGPPPPAWANPMPATACQAIADWMPENGAG